MEAATCAAITPATRSPVAVTPADVADFNAVMAPCAADDQAVANMALTRG